MKCRAVRCHDGSGLAARVRLELWVDPDVVAAAGQPGLILQAGLLQVLATPAEAEASATTAVDEPQFIEIWRPARHDERRGPKRQVAMSTSWACRISADPSAART